MMTNYILGAFSVAFLVIAVIRSNGFRSLQHAVYLRDVHVTEHRRNHTPLRNVDPTLSELLARAT
jgi:hypothetical protein